ncbi:MAG: hypothetical protein HON53_18760 [Planctomycetaceae bacterium]|jgi:pimeloyl-ACP methyl ester carboxylesterase|nr:hypothetical protein [Planctomycetaceae bacterium]MBT6158146.1 hypothetical protein [Planctomycetaceae bacterium]MBT6484450.1 hypothetical protein [Planctomycetaceae bacterium]MBT6494905.1 hypothetical protein [Planctomycetaceae bacterium]
MSMRSSCQFRSDSSGILSDRLRSAVAAIMASVSVLLATTVGFAQDKATKVIHDDIVLTTARPDNLEIHITYYQSDVGKEAPVVILLHAEGSNRQVWLGNMGFAQRLWDEGYAVIAVDLRKHGQSVVQGPAKITPADRQRMVAFDMEAVKAFIFEKHMDEQLNMNKTAIIAPEMSAAVAILYTIRDWKKPPHDDGLRTPRGQDIRSLLLLSPESKTKGLNIGASITDIGKLAANTLPAMSFSTVFFYGAADKKDKRGGTKRMYSKAAGVKGVKKNVLLQAYPFKYRGVELIGRNNARTRCEEQMLGFLDGRLKKLTQTPWKDRRSAFNRN